MPQNKLKVLVIFPSYSDKQASHYPYWYSLFEEAGKQLDITLLFEACSTKPSLKNVSQVCQSITRKPINLVERFRQITQLIESGYTNIYIHYSYWSVIISWLIKYVLMREAGIIIYYWNCEKYETKPRNILLQLSLHLCDVLVTGHETIANSYKHIFGLSEKDSRIVPNWVDVEHKKYPKPKSLKINKKNILFVHHLSPRKGSRELPEIIQKTIDRNPKVHFHIIGDGPDKKWLESRIKDLKVDDYVTMNGSLPINQVKPYYQHCDICIMPSRSEGFPRVFLEAMMYKIPIVASRTGCTPEIVSRPGKKYIVPVKNPIKFSQKVVEMMEINSEQINQLVEKNYLNACVYSQNNSLKKFINLFKV